LIISCQILKKKIRNAIGHESWEYIPYEHKIVFYDERKSVIEEIYLLDYVYKCWLLLDKTIIIYKVLQDIKRHRMLTINNNAMLSGNIDSKSK